MSSRFSFFWKSIVAITIAVMAFAGPFADRYLIPRAQAEGEGSGGISDTPTIVPCGVGVWCTDQRAAEEIDKVKKRLDFQIMFPLYMGVLNAVTIAAQQLAYDSAEWVASGFKGKSPLIEVLKFQDYTRQIALDAAGEFIGTFSEQFTQGMFGINLCRPPQFQGIDLAFALSIPDLAIQGIARPKPKCEWTDVVNNWSATADSLDNAVALSSIKRSFSVGGNDISYGIGLHTAFFDYVAEKKEAGILDRLEGRGFKSVEDLVSGNIRTPASVVQENINEQIIRQPNASENLKTGALLSNSFKLGFVQIGTVMVSTFSNVLVSRLLGRLTKGLLSSGTTGVTVPDLLSSGAAPLLSQAGRSEQVFASQYSEILTPNITSPEQQDILGEMLGCPDNGRTKWNCSIDSTLEAGLRKNGHMTLRQAIDGGFINEDWELIPSTQAKDNLDPGCAQRAFCTANLRKMRLARIVPIGWELAADSPANQLSCQFGMGGCVSLGEVIREFDNCNDAGELDQSHPYCHLIDPNWVLTAFPTQCLTKGYGNAFLSGTSQRLQECQDTVSCLERNAAGNCVGGYGYCMAEQTFWQFDAESCKEEYVSCRSYTPRGTNAKPIGYLRSTIDYGSCDESNVGCMWYANTRNASDRTNDNAWTATYSGNVGKTYFDKTISRCDGQYEGCTDVRRVTNGRPSLNLIRNGSFEETNTETRALTGWVNGIDSFLEDDAPVAYQEPSIASGAASADGARGYATAAVSLQQMVRLIPGRQYVFSFYARGMAGNLVSAGANMRFYRADGERELTPPPTLASEYRVTDDTFYKSAGCATAATGYPSGGGASGQVNVTLPSTLGTDWQRFQCSFVAPPEAGWGRLFLVRGTGNPWLIDAVKFEEGEVATAFNEGLDQTLESITMKVPPAELNCSGNEATDHELCQKFARVCRALEAGCQGYRPKGQSGAPEIPAVLTNADICPSECAGYAEFRKQASPFDLVRNTEIEALNDAEDQSVATFIPSTGAACSAQDIGCESFTNLQTEEASGFSYLRSCEQPNDVTQTYYTWEGSEASGYQLVTWSLQRDAEAPLPQGPFLIQKVGPDGALKDPASCNALSYVTAIDPDCRQFYDPQGNVFYRFESQTILADTACASFRKEGSTRADCEKTGGIFTEATNQCVYHAVSQKSRSCALSVAGCRAYVGTRGQARAEVFSEDFAGDGYAVNPEGAAMTLNTSEESILVGDRSLRIVASGGQTSVTFDVPTQPGLLYELEFWGKTSNQSPITVGIAYGDAVGTTYTNIGNGVVLRPVWNVYRIGPFIGSASTNGMTRIRLSGFVASPSFLDTIRVTQVTDVAYVVRDSWNTPASCDRTPEGVYQPQAMLGCQEYVDRNNAVSTVRQFTRLCRESAIGCSAFIHTENSENVYEQRWEKDSVGRTEVTARKADHFEYYIESSESKCPRSQMSCTAFGLPKFDQDRLALDAAEPFQTIYIKDDVTKYEDAICTESELFCESFAFSGGGQSGTEYFRSPSTHACEYKTGAVVAVQDGATARAASPGCDLPNPENYVGTTYDGWFKVGTECPCYPEMLRRGSTFGILYSGDTAVGGTLGYNPWDGSESSRYPTDQTYEGWTGVCPETQAECSEFRDIADLSDPAHPQGRPYFVINDERLDKESCNGKVDPGQGCVLFRDTSNTSLSYNSEATFDDYKTRGYTPVAPIDCVSNSNHPSCTGAVGTCGDLVLETCTQQNGTPCTIEQQRAILSNQSLQACGIRQVEGAPVSLNDCNRTDSSDAGSATSGSASNRLDWSVTGTCQMNDSNTVLKVKADRSCSQWLACKTGETVYDQQSGQYKSICSELALCNDAKSTDQGEGIPFCTSYVDRSSTSETILQNYQVTDAATYASRAVGFGAVDYSGFTIPNHFQVMDSSLKPVAYMLSSDSSVASKFKKDYRLAVPVPIGADARVATAAEQSVFTAQGLTAPACVFTQTNAYGIRTNTTGQLDAAGTLCWLSMDQSPPAQLGISGSSIVADNLSVPVLIDRFGSTELPESDQILAQSFPNTQCKAAPEPDSPFSNNFVLEWDDTTNPPEPTVAASGYGNANFCEYGEDCACVYKRVQYGGGKTKFYEPLSTDVVNAVCSGGSRDGLPCIPSSGIEGSQDVSVTVTAPSADAGTGAETTILTASAAGEDDVRCGEGGTCVPISGVQLVRGVIGQCLEYDTSRSIAGDTTRSECLTWNPTPVLSGPGDQYHWNPTAGFQPPQSSGRYYCSSPVRPPRNQQFNPESVIPDKLPKEGLKGGVALAIGMLESVIPGSSIAYGIIDAALGGPDMTSSCGEDDKYRCTRALGPALNSEGRYAGRISSLFYADWFTSDGSCSNFLFFDGCTGNESGASLDGHKADGTQEGDRCESIDDEKGQGPVADDQAMRLVTTGQGTGRSYAEYAILFDPVHVAYAALGTPATDWESAMDYSTEDTIANFTFSVPNNKIGCAYSETWGDAEVENYNKKEEKNNGKGWGEADNTWHATFQRLLQDGGGTLNRSTAKIVTEDGTPGGIPVKVDCAVQNTADRPDNRSEDGLCFIKTWELNYRADGQQKFQAFTSDIGRNGLDHLSRRPVYGKCESSDPWFSIRAVFEDINATENNRAPEEVNPDQLVGPFQFVGLWVTACAPGNETRYIYMHMNMNSADICRELLETISKDSHDAVVFTDRNSSDGTYSMKNGFSWSTKNIPFGASLATGDADDQPLFMTGVDQVDVNPLNPPTFTSPGQTYFTAAKYPTSKWGMLSNVFAKIYRIYGYYPRAVTRSDYACTDPQSPQFGQWCPPVEDLENGEELSREYCGLQGKCLRGGLNAAGMFEQRVCNVFSGVNRGLDCSIDPDICHKAPMEELNGVLTPMYGQCALFAGYHPVDGATEDMDPDGNLKQEVDAHWTQMDSGRFTCSGADGSQGDCPTECHPTATTYQTGCTRAIAIQGGAFRCQNSVRDPNKVKEEISGNPTFASYCTRESDNSSECPQEIFSDTCVANSNPVPCVGQYHTGPLETDPICTGDTTLCTYVVPAACAVLADLGTCANRPWAQCTQDADCHFSARNYWPSGAVNNVFYWTRSGNEDAGLGQHLPKLNNDTTLAHGQDFQYWISGDSWFTASEVVDGETVYPNNAVLAEAFWPAVPLWYRLDPSTQVDTCDDEDGVCFFATHINSANVGDTTNRLLTYAGWDDTPLLTLYPGFNPFIWFVEDGVHVSSNIQRGSGDVDPLTWSRSENPDDSSDDPLNDTPPYVIIEETGNYDDTRDEMAAHYGACESLPLMFREGVDAEYNRSITGICRGGGRDGETCGGDTDCRPANIDSATFTSLQAAAGSWCNNVTNGNEPGAVNGAYGRPSDTYADACWPTGSEAAANRPALEDDPAKDSNICTHPAGYWPRPQFCKDPNDEYCGLFGYDLGNAANSIRDDRPLPTDVTPGLSSPRYLRPGASSDEVSASEMDYNYVDYYNPIPPHTGAPDPRTCQGSQCRIASLDSFSVNGIAEGVVNGGSGSNVATVRFYAWAAHEQMPLRRVLVDWGDGTRTELPDTFLKNRKPYCGTPKECSETSGLTCETDADCPPGGGQCVTMGNCSNNPNKRCWDDAQCDSGGEAGFCESRTAFGSATDACEEQFFEFRHAYNCAAANALQGCGTLSRCSRDPSRTCTTAANCAPGDSCLTNTAQPEGCFDSATQACRFTPRLLLIDNWGWCSGECRSELNARSQQPMDAADTLIRHENGGCFDASLIKSNVNLMSSLTNEQTAIGPNECNPDRPKTDTFGDIEARRPWIVFPGSLQIRQGEEI